jgi:hypothetical protein
VLTFGLPTNHIASLRVVPDWPKGRNLPGSKLLRSAVSLAEAHCTSGPMMLQWQDLRKARPNPNG